MFKLKIYFHFKKVLILLNLLNFPLWADAEVWRVGASKKDITYFSQGRGMMGYGDFAQKTRGIESSLFSRTFVVESSSARVGIVVVDLCMMFSHIKAAVLERLNSVSEKKWKWSDLMIMATHTHSGPGGYAQHDIYNVTTQGFDEKNFETIVSGITNSILEAQSKLEPATLSVARGELRGASVNRSIEPYQANIEADLFEDFTDPSHYVLAFRKLSGEPLGLLDFFAVHTTSMSKKNKLISSDNKGRAAQNVEKHFGGGFVAAFANANEGDASPNIFKGTSLESEWSDLQKVEHLAKLQSQDALRLWNKTRPVGTLLESAHAWVKMPDNGCEPAMGESFAAGAEDGPSELPGFYEGMRQGEFRPLPNLGIPIVRAVQALVGSAQGDSECQFPKPILFAGDESHRRILPRTLPFHLIRLGDLLLAGVPAEMTTMSGRRLRTHLQSQSELIGIKDVIIGGLANEYSGYVTTPEEYQFQHYEGAHTLYGEKTLSIHLDTFAKLLLNLEQNGSEVGVAPSFFRPLQNFMSPARHDGKWFFEKRGHVIEEPKSRVFRWESIKFVVRSGLPSRMQEANSGMFVIQKKISQRWFDLDLPASAQMEWRRESPLCYNCSRLTFTMKANLPIGEYRILHKGEWTSRRSKDAYESQSNSFLVF